MPNTDIQCRLTWTTKKLTCCHMVFSSNNFSDSIFY